MVSALEMAPPSWGGTTCSSVLVKYRKERSGSAILGRAHGPPTPAAPAFSFSRHPGGSVARGGLARTGGLRRRLPRRPRGPGGRGPRAPSSSPSTRGMHASPARRSCSLALSHPSIPRLLDRGLLRHPSGVEHPFSSWSGWRARPSTPGLSSTPPPTGSSASSWPTWREPSRPSMPPTPCTATSKATTCWCATRMDGPCSSTSAPAISRAPLASPGSRCLLAPPPTSPLRPVCSTSARAAIATATTRPPQRMISTPWA